MDLPAGADPLTIRQAVRDRYDAVARDPDAGYTFRVGRAFAEALGYPADLLDTLPPEATAAFTGVAAPSLLADVRPGQVVVDLGTGGGLDLALLARQVGPRGRAIGVDFAPAMVERARALVARLGLPQAVVQEAPAEATGLPDACADWVVVNGLLNLAPDKAAVVREAARVLRPGGHLLLAETTLRAEPPPGSVRTLDDWFR